MMPSAENDVPVCGTARGYRRHRRAGEKSCDQCREAWTAYCREHSRPLRSWSLKPCGTEAAYRRHLRHGESPCPACTDAAVAANASRVIPPGEGKADA